MKMRFAIDDNLGVPAGFIDRLAQVLRDNGAFAGCEVVSFHDIGAMVRAFDSRNVAMMLAPAGTIPYIKNSAQIIAEAAFGPERKTSLSSILLQRASDAPATPEEALRRKVGRVNRYCTTSYWAHMVTLNENPAAPDSVEFYEAAGFDDMLFSVLDGRSDVAMVWDAVLDRHPDAAPKLRVLARHDDLPTPLLLANELLPDSVRDVVVNFATQFQSEKPEGYFAGFTVPDWARIERFRVGMTKAKQHFAFEEEMQP